MKKFAVLLFLTFLGTIAYSQETITRYFNNDDLTCGLISKICQDQDGFIWIGTLNGLNIYDGWTFRHIYAQANDPNALVSNYIHELFSDSKGRLWVGTNLGLQLYDRKTGQFHNVLFPEGRSVTVENMAEMADGELWIINGNIFRLDPDSMSAEPIEKINNLTGSTVTEAFTGSDGTIWLASSRSRVFRMKGEDWETVRTDGRLYSFIEDDGIIYAASRSAVYRWNDSTSSFEAIENDCAPYATSRLLRTRDGKLYVSTYTQGFRAIDKTAMKVVPTERFHSRDIDLDIINVSDWMEDRSGNIWICSAFSGVAMTSDWPACFFSAGQDVFDVPYDDMVNAVFRTRDGKTWVGTERGKLYNTDDNSEIVDVQTLPANIYSLYELDDRTLMAGTRLHGLFLVDRRTGSYRQVEWTEGRYVKKIVEAPDGDLIFSLFTQGIAFIDRETLSMSGYIRAGSVNTVACDKDGLIWCGTYNGVRCYNYEDRSEQVLHENKELSSAVVYSLYEDNDGIMWIGTSDGLFSYDKATETFGHYRLNGLENNVICGIAGDGKGIIWVSTQKGLVRFDTDKKETSLFISGNGLFDTEYIRGSYWQEPGNGKIYFGGQREVTEFYPDRIIAKPLEKEPVLTGVYIAGKPAFPGTLSTRKPISETTFPETTVLRLSRKDTPLALAFSVMDFRETQNIVTEYSIDGSGQWTATPYGSNVVTLENLSRGRHDLLVRFSENGSVSPEKKLSVVLMPHWAASWLACAIYLLLLCLAAWEIWRIFKKNVRKREQDAVDKDKYEYLRYLTHEIRTPLTLMTTSLQKLSGKEYDEETSKGLKSAQQNAEKVVFLLDKTMDLGRIDEDGSDLKFREINLIKYISNMLTVFTYPAMMGNIDISFTNNTDRLPVWIDRSKFDDTLMNLLEYSIKSEKSGGKIEVEARQNDKYAEIIIKDDGKAFEKDMIPHIFDLFQRDDSGDISSTNMELYRCKDVVNLHKGTISASNRTDCEGKVFTIRIPVGNAHIPANQIASRDSILDDTWSSSFYYNASKDIETDEKTSASGRHFSIVAIDGNPDICRYFHTLLGSRFNVSTFTDATEGYNSAITDVPDLVIAEMMMSDMDGLTLVKRLKGNSNTAHVPILLLTALPEEDIRLQGLLTGADAIISKPFNEKEFILVCTNLIMSRSRLASHIKEMQISKDMIAPVELQSNNDILMQKVLAIINERISDPDLNVEILADEIGISRGHLHRKIKEITGTSPGEYIRAIRLNQAAQLLKGAKKNISQIAYSVGYNNPSVFSTAFKSFFGISAKEYQKRYAGSDYPQEGQTT